MEIKMKNLFKLSRGIILSLLAAVFFFANANIAAADKIKVAAIYTLPVEQQWISRA